MEKLAFVIDDGGRSKYFTSNKVGDCVTRAFAIASQRDYKEVYNELYAIGKESPRNGVKKSVIRRFAKIHGYEWVPLMTIGSGCHHRLAQDEIPMTGRLVCSVSHHCVAVIDGVIHDTYDCARDGKRCVYGYWIINNETKTTTPIEKKRKTKRTRKATTKKM